MLRLIFITLMGIFLISCSSARIAQQLQFGKMTFESGDYHLAFHELLPLAVEGNQEAQYAIGYMYFYGYGVAADESIGLFWMERSAGQGYAPAAEALQLIHHRKKKKNHPKQRPVFKNGVPQVTAKNTMTRSPIVKMLTKADLPQVVSSVSQETQPLDPLAQSEAQVDHVAPLAEIQATNTDYALVSSLCSASHPDEFLLFKTSITPSQSGFTPWHSVLV